MTYFGRNVYFGGNATKLLTVTFYKNKKESVQQYDVRLENEVGHSRFLNESEPRLVTSGRTYDRDDPEMSYEVSCESAKGDHREPPETAVHVVVPLGRRIHIGSVR